MGKPKKPYTEAFKETVKQAYLDSGDSLAAIAKQFGVGQRTVEGWASEGAWDAKRRAQKVVSIGEAKSKSQPPKAKTQKPVNSDPTPHREPMRARALGHRNELNEVEIVEDAIYSLSALVTGCLRGGITDDEERTTPIDTRGIGGTASALVRLLEYRRKLKPPTAAELAELAIAMNVRPDEFLTALKDAWRLRA